MILVGFLVGNAHSQDDGSVSYADLEPILKERCVLCHAGDAAPLGLRLDSFESLMNGSVNGPVVAAGDPAGSELVRRLTGVSQPRMPMTGPPFLSAGQIALFERWVAAGLERGDTATVEAPVPAEPAQPAIGEAVTYAHVAPIFGRRCVKCHADNGIMGAAPEGYLLTSYEAVLASADRARVVPGRPEASALLRHVRGQALPRMPFDGPPYLAEEEIDLLEAWIAGGARNAEGVAASIPAGAKVRLHGTLASRWTLDDLPLALSSRTRIDKAPGPGTYVEVRGRLDGNGAVKVDRIRSR